MEQISKREIGWAGLTAIGLGGSSLIFYTLNSLVSTYGSIVIPVFIFAFLLTFFCSFGYIELVLMYPKKIGGIAAVSFEAFRPYSPILTNIIGVGYWLAWLTAASFAAIYTSSIIQLIVPWVSVNALSTFFIAFVTMLNLVGLKWVKRFSVPIAGLAAFLTVLSIMIPVFTGSINWNESINYTLNTSYPDPFGKVTSVMAALYLIGWIVPGYECTLCYVGETIDPKNNVKRAMFISMFLAAIFYVLVPLVWLGTIGHANLAKDLVNILGLTYSPLLGEFTKAAVVWCILFNLLICLFAPLSGPPRTLSQLAKDGLLPEFLGMTSSQGMPWVAMIITGLLAIVIVWLGAPLWLIAATNFQYLLCISLASIAVWLLRKDQPSAPRLYRAPSIFIYMGLFSAFIWAIATILGFRQYGLFTIIIGTSFSFLSVPFYLWRKMMDRKRAGLKVLGPSLHFKLTGTLVAVLIFDAMGYLIAVNHIDPSAFEFIAVLEDIFVLVALITLTVGVVIPSSVVSATEQINIAARRIIKTNLKELSQAIDALGSGNLNKLEKNSPVIPIHITSRDEIGEMGKSFNLMQNEIMKTYKNIENVRIRLKGAINKLTELNMSLENRVIERTEALEKTNVQLKKEIIQRSKDQVQINSLHKKLINAAREAGMADIATSTLHNVGNVLNSVNISTEVILDIIVKSRLDDLKKVANLIEVNQQQIEFFLTKDEKGQYIPKYLINLGDTWLNEKTELVNEISSLKEKIRHIKEIISTEQRISKSSGLTEEIAIKKLIQDALMISKLEKENGNIEIISHVESVKKIVIDRVKLLQIIVNLIKNGMESVIEQNPDVKTIIIDLKPIDDKYFQLDISDNGVGIDPECITKIFSSGFTTKNEGHGFGLHSSALAAKEMGGSLNAKSQGRGQGATFTLILPYMPRHHEG